MSVLNRKIAVAPMMDYTDRHFRYLLRLLSKDTLLYTEMVTSAAILKSGRKDLLTFSREEHPVALQLGGSEPDDLARCALLAQEQGYDEVNLNCGCPSPRVSKGRFGACLMKEPNLVAECVAAMAEATSLPVTVKTRLGVDEYDDYPFATNFIETVAKAGCDVFIMHARKAWLNGISPKQNREIPPLDYERVFQLKKDFPELTLVINGGINTLEQVRTLLKKADGVMLGRKICQDAFFLSELQAKLHAEVDQIKTRQQIVKEYLVYMREQAKQGVPLTAMSRHLISLFQGLSGARAWRRMLSETVRQSSDGIGCIEEFLFAQDLR